MSKSINRRRFLKISALTMMGAAIQACATSTPAPAPTATSKPAAPAATNTTAPAAPAATAQATAVATKPAAPAATATAKPAEPTKPVAAVAKFKESPALAELVKAGKLPPVEQRVPEEPHVVKPIEKVGKYGGEWRLGGIRRGAFMTRTTEYENLVRWNVEWTDIIPNVVKSWQVADEGRTYTFSLRKGMKWSDGTPFTADDILFWYEAASNKEISPTFSKTWSTGNDPVVVTKTDDYTVKFAFKAPYGLFITRLATPGGELYQPAKFRKQFYPAYASKDAVAKMQKDWGGDTWVQAYANAVDPGLNVAAPVLWAWKYTSKFGDSPRYVAERNPYYWKVDTDGNQLPYIDRVVFNIAQDTQVLVMQTTAGELDFQDLYVTALANKALYMENAKTNDLRFIDVPSGESHAFPMSLNVAHKDPEMRKVIGNKNFRIALSHALNRQEVNEVVFFGLAQIAQPSPLKESPLYDQKMETQYLEYDPKKANQLLDEIMPKKDADGFRLRPDGKPFGIICDVDASDKTKIDSMEMVKKYWAAVGINMAVKATENSLINTRAEANEHDMSVIYSIPGGMDAMLDPRGYMPYGVQSYCFVPWAQYWLSGGKQGEEPPAPAKKQQELFDKLLQTVGTAAQNEIMKQILAIARDEFWQMGIVRPAAGYAICKNKFRNVPAKYWGSWQYPNPAPLNTCQFFWDK